MEIRIFRENEARAQGGPQGGPRGPKFDLLGRIGPKKVLQTRSELASRLRASDDQKKKVCIFVKTRRRPREGPRASYTFLHKVQQKWNMIIQSGINSVMKTGT